MKHINLSNFKGSITDWTELNYIKGGLADEYADVANVKGNYVKKSENLAPTPSWEGGYHANNGSYFGNYSRGITDRTDNYVKPNTEYTLSFNLLLGNSTVADRVNFIAEYTSDGTFVKRSNIIFTTQSENGLNVGTFTTQPTTAYIEFSIYTSAMSGDYTAFFNGCITNVMLNEGSTALPYQPGSTSGLYIEDNINDELIPINDPNVLTRVALSLSKNTSDILEEDIPIDSKDVK